MAPPSLEDSLPDFDTSPSRMAEPIGTPRRHASMNTNFLPGLGSQPTNGGFGAIGGRSHGSNGLPFSSRVNSPTPIASSNSTQNLWNRFGQMKLLDANKDKLLHEVLTRYTCLEQEHNEYVKQVEAERLIQRATESEEYYRTYYEKLSDMARAQPFILVLIDGDGMIFDNYLLRLGEQGGKQAADLLHKAVCEWARVTLTELPPDFKVVTRIFANVKGLAETCRRAGIVSNAELVEDFARGLTIHKNSYNFVDVGPGKDRADEKIKEEFRLYVANVHCRHVLFGCSHDNGFARLLEDYIFNTDLSGKITLMEGVPFEKELATLPYNKKKFEGLFRENKINLNMPDLLTDMPRSRQDSKNNFNPATGIFTPKTRTPAPDTPVFSPRTTTMPPPGLASPASSIRGDLSRTNSIASSYAISDAPAVVQGTGAAGNGWANIARASAQLPFQDLTRQQPVPTKITKSTGGPVVQQNKYGQRVDVMMDYDHDRVYELKKMKYCNQHYIGKGCCHWEAGNGACPHKHDTKLSKEDLKWLKVVARETVCKKGTSCIEPDCIYGHHCPYPKMTEGSMRGVGCINGEKCRFARDMHGMEMTVVKIIRAEPEV